MKGVLLAGGLGTRLRPLTSVVNKHLLPIHKKPMLFYPLEMMAQAGIEEVMLVVGGHSTEEILKLCKDGTQFGLKRLYYVYQDGEGGIAAALALTEQFAAGGDICVVLGDNILLGESLKRYKEAFENRSYLQGAMVLLAQVDDPENYGIPTIAENKILYITEKPERPMTKQAVIGVYFYDRTVFFRIKDCKPSNRGELEITDVNNSYAEVGMLGYMETKGKWIDAGSSIEAWLQAGQLVEKYSKEKKEEHQDLAALQAR